jgi:hypothetical protein
MHTTRLAIAIPVILVVLTCGQLLGQNDPIPIKIAEDLPALEFVGQFVNDSSGSHQYGYISRIDGLTLNSIFSGTPQGQDTALFTFCSETKTIRAVTSGVLTIVNREGPSSTTTVYFTPNPVPRDAADRSTFCSGTPIQVSSYRQQVVVDTSTLAFTTVHVNTITSVSPFNLKGIPAWPGGEIISH